MSVDTNSRGGVSTASNDPRRADWQRRLILLYFCLNLYFAVHANLCLNLGSSWVGQIKPPDKDTLGKVHRVWRKLKTS